MNQVYFIIFALVVLDLVFLTAMPRFYIMFGLPILRRTYQLPFVSVFDIEHVLASSNHYTFRKRNNTIIFRSKFTYSNLYRMAILSIVKGELTLDDVSLKVVLRLNNTTIYVLLTFIYLLLYEKVDVVGICVALIIFVMLILYTILGIKKLETVLNEIVSQNVPYRKEAPISKFTVITAILIFVVFLRIRFSSLVHLPKTFFTLPQQKPLTVGKGLEVTRQAEKQLLKKQKQEEVENADVLSLSTYPLQNYEWISKLDKNANLSSLIKSKRNIELDNIITFDFYVSKQANGDLVFSSKKADPFGRVCIGVKNRISFVFIAPAKIVNKERFDYAFSGEFCKLPKLIDKRLNKEINRYIWDYGKPKYNKEVMFVFDGVKVY